MRILLIETDSVLLQTISDYLKKNRVTVDSIDYVNAMQYIRTNIYDVIVLDIMLSNSIGLSILETLRQEKYSVPVILISDKSSLQDKLMGFDRGADDYITKPLLVEELFARIKAMCKRKGELKQAIVTFGDLTLNMDNCELISTNTQQAVKLSLKEYQILQLLFDNPKQIITKERIIEKIWGNDNDIEYNNVEVYISFIRRKLEYLKVQTQIRTARGIGYSLEERRTSAAVSDIRKLNASK